MARLARLCPLGIPQHIIQRGNNRQVCFASDEDMSVYVRFLNNHAREYGVSLHAFRPC